jgi:hypothetical protein
MQWSLLELAAANPDAGYRLLQACPALALQIVRHYRPALHGDRTTYLRTTLTRPWREILDLYCLPPRPRTRRILGLLPPQHCYPVAVDKLVRVLQTPGHRWIHVVPHLHRITRDTVSLLAGDPEYINAHLLRASVDSDFDTTDVYSTVMSVRQLLAELRRAGEWPYREATFEQLKLAEGRLHDRTYVDCCLPFPVPPIPGCERVIEPIRDYGALADEGAALDHCVATLIADVVRGEIYAYRVLTPTRATLVLQRVGGGWQIQDLRGAKNADVPAETQAVVASWLNPSRPEN